MGIGHKGSGYDMAQHITAEAEEMTAHIRAQSADESGRHYEAFRDHAVDHIREVDDILEHNGVGDETGVFDPLGLFYRIPALDDRSAEADPIQKIVL